MSRQTAREALGTLLSATMTSAQEVNDYLKTDLDGLSPVVCIASAGQEAVEMTFQGNRYRYYFDVVVFVLRGETGTATYTEEDADDVLDTLAGELATVVDANATDTNWESLIYSDRSTVDAIEIAGEQYWMESHPLVMEAY